jgi:hypothetical protein
MTSTEHQFIVRCIIYEAIQDLYLQEGPNEIFEAYHNYNAPKRPRFNKILEKDEKNDAIAKHIRDHVSKNLNALIHEAYTI